MHRILAATCLLAACESLAVAQPTTPAPPVAVSNVVQKTVATGQTFVGTVMAARRSIVGSAVEGRVLEFRVNEGDYVKAGDVLAQIRTGTLEIHKISDLNGNHIQDGPDAKLANWPVTVTGPQFPATTGS